MRRRIGMPCYCLRAKRARANVALSRVPWRPGESHLALNSLPRDTVLKSSDSEPVLPAATDRRIDFDRAVEEHRSYLIRIAVASTRNVSDAEDIVQEALMRAHRGLKNFRGDCPLRMWMARIIVRVSINHRKSFIRRVKRWTFFSDHERENSAGEVRAFDAADGSTRIDREALIDVDRQMKRLPEEFRIPLLMLAVKGMTIPEIAEILEIPEGTVKSRIFYGRKRLKKALRP